MMLIKDGRVIDPGRGIDDVLDLRLEGDRILKIGKYHRSEEYEQIIEARGLIVAPGLVGAESGAGEPAGGEARAARGGYTAMAAQPAGRPDEWTGQCLVETVAADLPVSPGGRYQIIEGLKDGRISRIFAEHLETALALGVTNLVHKGHLTIMELIEKMSLNPARYYGLNRGVIEEGAEADLVIFSDAEKWRVEPGLPFAGLELYGRVLYTINGGKVVYGNN